MLTQERLKEVLNYDPESGIFTWRTSGSGRGLSGLAGCICSTNGYVYIGVDRKTYYAHRLAVLYMEGYLPENTVDHKDRIRHHNCWDNLREASPQCQMRNRSDNSNNVSGIKGVHWAAKSRKWKASIAVNRRSLHLGYFDDKLEAAYHRFAAEQCLGFQDCDINSSALRFIKGAA